MEPRKPRPMILVKFFHIAGRWNDMSEAPRPQGGASHHQGFHPLKPPVPDRMRDKHSGL